MRHIAKCILFALLLILLTGCGWFGRKWASFAGEYTVCVDGVEYIQFASGVTVKYRPDGKIATCQ